MNQSSGSANTGNWNQCLTYWAVTDVGMRRSNNQDAHAVSLASDLDAWKKRGHIFVVADGMGAHAAGELASELAASGVAHRYHKYQDLSPVEALQKAIQETNSEIHGRGQANTDFHNMGTTASVLLMVPQGAVIAHVGDSRVYRLRGTQLDQITFDHSLVWELRAAGQLSDDSDLAGAIPKNVITRSLGPNAAIQIDFEGPFPLEVGDTYLLCSDGLTGQVEDDELATVLAHLPPAEASQLLVDLANLRGGPDNITVIVVKVVGEQMASRRTASEPLVIQTTPGPRGVHPILWLVAGVCFLTAIGLLVTAPEQWVPAAIAAGGGLVALLSAGWQQLRIWSRSVNLGHGRRLGKGPHRTAQCIAPTEMVATLAQIVDELRQAATENRWTVDWGSFDRYTRQAVAAAQAQRYSDSLQQYGHAVRFMMQELRSQNERRGDSSSIEY